MRDVSKLMIGDFVYRIVTYVDLNGKQVTTKQLIQVCSVEEHSVQFKTNIADSSPSMIYITVMEDEIEPIELTEEILEKNCFEKWSWYKRTGQPWWDAEKNIVITYAIGNGFQLEKRENSFMLVDCPSDLGDYGYEANWITEVKYVHQLQHIVKTLDIDKEITL